MCLPIDCWICMPRAVDDDPAPARRTTQHAQRNHYNGNGNGNGHNGNGYTAHSSMAAAEADRKTSNDVRRGPAHATGAQEKAAAYPYAGADETTLKHLPAAAWNGRVAAADGHGAARGGGAPRNYYSYERAQPPAHGEDAAADYHYMAAAAATADHERY